MGNVTYSSATKKFGQAFGGGGGGSSYKGSGNTVEQGPDMYSPLLLNSNLNLPRDKRTINSWCRQYMELNPFIANAINLHSTYPISKLNITCANKKAEKFFKNMVEELDLMNICIQIASEYWLLGEAVVYADYDENRQTWSRLVLQNPDNIVIEPSVISAEPNIFIKPDKNLERIVKSNKPADLIQKKQLSNVIIECVKQGKNIPLEPFNVSLLARKTSPYALRGVGLPFSVFKQLMLFDKLKESKYAQADNMVNPMTIIKIGNADYKPTFADIEAYRSVFENAQNDKDFKVFTHEGVTVEKVGSGAAIYDIGNDITQITKEIYTGLMVPSVLMDGGGDTTYANGGVALDVLKGRYMTFRNVLSSWLKKKIFAPISKAQGFYDIIDGEKHITVPDIDWNHMSLFDTDTYISTLKELTAGGEGAKRVSVQTLHRALGLDTVDEQRKIRNEAIAEAIYKKEVESLAMMDLNDLRSLNEEDEIPEMTKSQEGEASPAGGDAPGGGLDLGGGPLPGQESAPPPMPDMPAAPTT